MRLREDKRARPIVLRCCVGDTLLIQLQNLLPDNAAQPEVGLHLEGMELLPATATDLQILTKLPDALSILPNPMNPQAAIDSDGTWAGANLGSPGYPPVTPAAAGPGSLVASGQTKVYRLFARAEGAFLLYSGADDGQGGGQIDAGLFGAVVVEPSPASFFRSQVTRTDLAVATKGRTNLGQPMVNYQARYAQGATYPSKQPIPYPTPVLDMLIERPEAGPNVFELVHSDLTAIVSGRGTTDGNSSRAILRSTRTRRIPIEPSPIGNSSSTTTRRIAISRACPSTPVGRSAVITSLAALLTHLRSTTASRGSAPRSWLIGSESGRWVGQTRWS